MIKKKKKKILLTLQLKNFELLFLFNKCII